MDAMTEALFEAFANAATLPVPDREDRRRLYQFAVHVHASNLPVKAETVRRRLLLYGFPEDVASKVSAMFECCCELLSEYDRHPVFSGKEMREPHP